MKRIRLDRWSGQLLSTRTRSCCLRSQQLQHQAISNTRIRRQSSLAESQTIEIDESDDIFSQTSQQPPSESSTSFLSQAASSAKLAALHARLSLPQKIPLSTIARTLIDPSADSNFNENNASLAQVGGAIISYHVSEHLLCTYPRLPMTVLFAASYAYNGPQTLQLIAQEWGVETAAFPGPEVDPGLLQFSKMAPGTQSPQRKSGLRNDYAANWRRGMSSRVVYDDEFGDTIPKGDVKDLEVPTDKAYAQFVKAVVGSIYLHAGREAAKMFVNQHILSRHLAMETLFQFENPVRELSRLCAREEFEYPVARMLSETGRNTRAPVFVVGIFSGNDKLGEGAGPSLLEARIRAAVAALKAWYLYSPGRDARVPSEMEGATNRAWEPVHIDIGEIIH